GCSRAMERLGGTKTIDIDVRIIAATNKDLENAIIEKKFREDLYYRLNVVPIFMPALRDRKEDIPLLAEHFLRQANEEHGKHCKLSEEAMQFLIEYGWPGNVREFENIMERAVIMAKGAVIGLKDLPIPIAPHNIQVPAQSRAVYKNQESYMLGSMVKNIEKNKIIEALKESNGIKARASRMLGITQRQLGYKIKKYGISVEVSAVVNDE
ncbi:MAG: sigma 54-interacting transcriptional regulator, partial [Deltaproteobacteria bacterium]|nr:sigma 54-interacting transcriptional regulator [Deltaproteobacteria bacterium]